MSKPTPHMPPPPVSTAFSRFSDSVTFGITRSVARVLGYLLQLGVLQGWSDRVKKDWEKGQLSIAARSFLYLLYFGRVPVKSVEDTRKKTDGLAALVPATAPLELECVTTKSGVPLEIVRSITTSQVKAPGVFFHVHGGGYQAGRAFAYRGFASELSKRLGGIEVVLVDYRLAPEADLLTETIVDCLDAYKHVVEKYGVDQLAIGGDSAGGGMISNLLHMIATENLPFPKAAVLLSPYIDLTFSYDTIEAHADVDAMILPDDAKNTAKICFAGKDYGPMDLPCMGPVNRAQEWPSILVMTGSHEVLTGDSRNFVKKLEKHGVDVTYVEQVGMPHVYPIFYTWMEEADHALSHMTQWTRSRIGF